MQHTVSTDVTQSFSSVAKTEQVSVFSSVPSLAEELKVLFCYSVSIIGDNNLCDSLGLWSRLHCDRNFASLGIERIFYEFLDYVHRAHRDLACAEFLNLIITKLLDVAEDIASLLLHHPLTSNLYFFRKIFRGIILMSTSLSNFQFLNMRLIEAEFWKIVKNLSLKWSSVEMRNIDKSKAEVR